MLPRAHGQLRVTDLPSRSLPILLGFFILISAATAQCQTCNKAIHIPPTTNLFRHLQSRHPAVYTEFVARCRVVAPDATIDATLEEATLVARQAPAAGRVPAASFFQPSSSSSSSPTSSSSSSSSSSSAHRSRPSAFTRVDTQSVATSPSSILLSAIDAADGGVVSPLGLNARCAIFCVEAGITPHTACLSSFRQVLRYHWNSRSRESLPSHTGTVNAVSLLSTRVRSNAESKLILSTSVTIMFDGCTDRNGVKHVPFIGISTSTDPTIALLEHATTREFEVCDANYYVHHLKETMKTSMARGMPIVAIATDNEAVLVAAHEALCTEERFRHFLRAPCMAHTIQLMVNKLFVLPRVRNIILIVYDLIRSFALKETKREYIAAANRKKCRPLVLRRYVPTRWSSMFHTLHSILRSRAIVEDCTPLTRHITDPAFWPTLIVLTNVLSAFMFFTNVAQSRAFRLAECILALHKLVDQLAIATKKSDVRALFGASLLSTVVKDVLKKHVAGSDSSLCLFSFAEMAVGIPVANRLFDVPVEDVSDWFEQWAGWFTHEYVDTNPSKAALTTPIDFHSDLAVRERASFVIDLSGDRILDVTMGLDTARSTEFPEMWRRLVDGSRLPSHLKACAYMTHVLLSIVPCEGEVERWFSSQKRIQAPTRSNLKNQRVINELSLGMQLRADRWRSAYVHERERIDKFLSSEKNALEMFEPDKVFQIDKAVFVPPFDAEQVGDGEQQQQQQQQQQEQRSPEADSTDEEVTEDDLEEDDPPPFTIDELAYMQVQPFDPYDDDAVPPPPDARGPREQPLPRRALGLLRPSSLSPLPPSPSPPPPSPSLPPPPQSWRVAAPSLFDDAARLPAASPPASSSDAPASSSDAPASSSDAPASSSDAPASSSVAPTASSVAPTASSRALASALSRAFAPASSRALAPARPSLSAAPASSSAAPAPARAASTKKSASHACRPSAAKSLGAKRRKTSTSSSPSSTQASSSSTQPSS